MLGPHCSPVVSHLCLSLHPLPSQDTPGSSSRHLCFTDHAEAQGILDLALSVEILRFFLLKSNSLKDKCSIQASNSFSFLESGKSKVKVPAHPVSSEGPLPGS